MEAAVLVFLFFIGMPESHFLDADSVRPARGGIKPPSAFSTVNFLSTAFYIGVQGA